MSQPRIKENAKPANIITVRAYFAAWAKEFEKHGADYAVHYKSYEAVFNKKTVRLHVEATVRVKTPEEKVAPTRKILEALRKDFLEQAYFGNGRSDPSKPEPITGSPVFGNPEFHGFSLVLSTEELTAEEGKGPEAQAMAEIE